MENKILSEIQNIINENKYMNGKATAANTIGIPEYVIYFSESGVKHVKNRHQDKYAPGSLFNDGLNYVDAAKKVSSANPTREDGPYGTKVKWIGVDTGSDIGYMGVAHGDPEDVAKMKDYVMPDSKNMEKVKVSGGERSSTKKASLITVLLVSYQTTVNCCRLYRCFREEQTSMAILSLQIEVNLRRMDFILFFRKTLRLSHKLRRS